MNTDQKVSSDSGFRGGFCRVVRVFFNYLQLAGLYLAWISHKCDHIQIPNSLKICMAVPFMCFSDVLYPLSQLVLINKWNIGNRNLSASLDTVYVNFGH